MTRFLIGLGLVAAQAYAQSPLKDRAVAQRLERETTDQRIQAYEKMLKAAPADPQVQVGLVSSYLQKLRETGERGYLDRASKLVDGMLDKDGDSQTALRFRNEIDLQLHLFAEVADRAEDMAKFTPSDPGVWANLGDASMDLGHYDRAGQAYTKMATLGPNLASYNRLAYHSFVTGDASGAIAFMRAAVEAGGPLAENTAWCWAELGDMYFKLGRLTEAEEAYRSGLALFPTLHRAHAGLGKVFAARGRVDDAIRSYQKAQGIVPMVEYAGALEDLYAAAGKLSKSREERDLIDAIDKLGKASQEKTNRNLALILADHNRNLPRALELMEAEIPVRGDVYTWDAYAWVLFKSGRLEEAAKASAKALRYKTPEPVFYFHASAISKAVGQPQKAQEYAGRVASLNSKFDVMRAEAPVSAR